jgi:hypothetical protein
MGSGKKIWTGPCPAAMPDIVVAYINSKDLVADRSSTSAAFN